jgi:steroid delta-isomerase-like uncharacterized protein
VTTTAERLSRADMDRILDAHLAAEARGDVAATLATLTEDVEHDVVGDPAGVLCGPAAVGVRYDHLFGNVTAAGITPTRRLYGEGFVVDDKIWSARVDGAFMGISGGGRTISVRVLHVFEFRGGRIARENVWIDGAAAVAQLTAPA